MYANVVIVLTSCYFGCS